MSKSTLPTCLECVTVRKRTLLEGTGHLPRHLHLQGRLELKTGAGRPFPPHTAQRP